MLRKNLLKKVALCILILILVYQYSPQIFKKVISWKEQTFIYPLRTKEGVLIRSDLMGDGHFGTRRSGGRRKHKGLDIAGPIGEPVMAAKSGYIQAGEVPRGMGKYVKISHPDGYVTIYGHLSKIDVGKKGWVWQGAKIGEVGKTGNANYRRMEPHLHFEIRKDNQALDPELYLDNKSD